MNTGRLVFSQIMDFVHRESLERCVNRYPMPRAHRAFSARDQFLSMAFAQITYRDSLRDIEFCLRGSKHLHAMGIRGNVTRTNLAYANEHRDWRVYQELASLLTTRARRLYADDGQDLGIEEMVYALDSTTIDLCMNLFPWATFRREKSAIKLHTLLDIRGSIPVFISITEASVHDVNTLDDIAFEPASIYVMDRGYIDFARLHTIEQARAYFVTRAKHNLAFYVVQSRPVDKANGLKCDQTIKLTIAKTKRAYPNALRRISCTDTETNVSFTFLSNHFGLSAQTIATLYKNRWKIELFFKWIKQNLRIKAFYGLSENAVKTQIWIAICVYIVVACLNKSLGINANLSKMLQVCSVNAFQKEPLNELLTKHALTTDEPPVCNQLTFNDF